MKPSGLSTSRRGGRNVHRRGRRIFLARYLAVLGLLLIAGPPPRSLAGTMSASLAQNFEGAQCDAANWKFLDPAELTRPDQEGLTIQIPSNAGGIASAGVAARFGLRGDFEITADFELLDVPKPKKGFGAGATISVSSADGQGASMQRVSFPDGAQAFVCHRAIPQPDGNVKHVVEVVPTDQTSGRIRLARTGAELVYFAAEGTSEDFRKLHQAAFSATDLRMLHLAAQTGESPNTVSVRWKRFQARADELLGEDGKSAGDRQLVVWGGLGAVGIFVLGLVWLKSAARRSGPNSAGHTQ